MKIIEGLFDHMVLQRDARNACDAVICGTCAGEGRVVAVVKRRGKIVPGFAAKPCGTARRGRFEARLRGLAAGGPYDIDLRVRDAKRGMIEGVSVRDVLVGDVWILAGQSNMQGCGRREHRAKPDPRVRAFYMNDRWRTAEDPIHNMDAALDPIHREINGGSLPPPERIAGVGPGVAFGKEMLRRTRVPQGLLACAHGGTSMAQWNPALKKLGGGSLYGATVRRVRHNGGKVAGVVWYQGESDANPDAAPSYTRAMRDLIRALRRDCDHPTLPVAIVQISRVIGWPSETAGYWNSIQDQQRRLPANIAHLATVPAIDLRLDDGIHIGGADQQRLGRRLAEAMDVLRRGNSAGKPPIEVAAVKISRQRGRDMAVVTVEFANVIGTLRSDGRATGFSFGESRPNLGVFDTQLQKNRALLYITEPPASLGSEALSYGAGANPVCNITDEADRSLPVFGPLALGPRRAFAPFCRAFDVAYLAKSFETLGARPPGGLSYKPWLSPAPFADSRKIVPQWPSEDGCLIYRAAIECAEKMSLELLLGYDGPVAAWVDGRRVAYDASGTNPCIADQLPARFAAPAGRHELIIALGNQNGRAWGIMVRLARRDLTRKQIETAPPAYAMPAWAG